MSNISEILVERDPLDGCVVRVCGDVEVYGSRGTIMNETDLHEVAVASQDPMLVEAFERLQAAKGQIGIELDILQPNF